MSGPTESPSSTQGTPPPDRGPSFELIRGDCRDVLPLLLAQVFDGIGIADWDHDVPGTDI